MPYVNGNIVNKEKTPSDRRRSSNGKNMNSRISAQGAAGILTESRDAIMGVGLVLPRSNGATFRCYSFTAGQTEICIAKKAGGFEPTTNNYVHRPFHNHILSMVQSYQ